MSFPALARWLPADLPDLNRKIAVRALTDVGVCEVPPGSNRSGVIDAYNAMVQVPEGSYWCASAVSAWWRDAGADVPGKLGSASCDVWMEWGKKSGRWSATPVIGAAVLYGVPTDASHIGVVVRLDPSLFSVEGNTTLDGYSRNGELVTLKAVNAKRLLGFIHPTPENPV